MMSKKYMLLFGIFILLLAMSSFIVSAAEVPDVPYLNSGVDLSGLIIIGSSILAIILFIITFIAYRRDGRKRLLYVSIAFFLFAIKGILLTIDAFLPQKGIWTDPLANILDFAILLSFFFGVVKKGG